MKQKIKIKYVQVEGCSSCERYKRKLKAARNKLRRTIDLYERILKERPVVVREKV